MKQKENLWYGRAVGEADMMTIASNLNSSVKGPVGRNK